MTESLIGSRTSFHKAVNPTVIVEPVETPLYFPALAGVAGLSEFGGKDGSTIVPAPRNARMDSSGKKGLAKRGAVISFVRTEAHRLSDRDTINGAQRKVLVVAIGSPADD